MIQILFFFSLNFFGLLAFIVLLLKFANWRIKTSNKEKLKGEKSITFLHPNCSDFGGGEKVLWEFVKALQEQTEENINKVYIVCGNNNKSVSEILSLCKSRFNLTLNNFSKVKEIQLIRLNSVEQAMTPKPRLTMLFQIIGQLYFSLEAVISIPSNTYIIDTTGLPFTYLVFYFFGFRISSYTHYPFISLDMINQVKNNSAGYVHSRSYLPFLKTLKIVYYKFILFLYQFNGIALENSWNNSSWTNSHMCKIWKTNHLLYYPPCGVDDLNLNKVNQIKEDIIVSLGQFRPEKDHLMQINIIKNLVKMNINLKLYMIGGARSSEDYQLIDNLKSKINLYGLEKHVFLMIDADFSEIKNLFAKAKIGLHTMKDEHFGISVIEMLASGLITVAHNSAGPKFDIIGSSSVQVGFLANSKILI